MFTHTSKPEIALWEEPAKDFLQLELQVEELEERESMKHQVLKRLCEK